MADPRNSYSVAPGDPARPGVLSRGALALVVGVAVVGLALVFPKDELLTRLRGEGLGSDRELTLTYLRNLVRTEPANVSLRLLLAGKLVAAGEYAEAQSLLAETRLLVDDADDQQRFNEIDLNLAYSRWQRLRERSLRPVAGEPAVDSAELENARQQMLQRLRPRVAAVRTPLSLFAYLQQARDLQAPELQEELLRRLPQLAGTGLADLLRGATEALAMGRFELSARLYFAAGQRSADTEVRRAAVMKGVRALLAAGQPVRAYDEAVRELGPLAEGDPMIWTLVDLALGAARPKDALAHWRRAVPQSWDAATIARNLNPQELERSMNLASGSGDLNLALKLVQAMLITRPGDMALQEREARMHEWLQRPGEALRLWQELARRESGDRALDNIFRLAPMLYDDEALMFAWQALARRRELTLAEIGRVIEAWERLGDPRGALRMLDQIEAQGRDSPELIAARAGLLERAGMHVEAIAAYERLRERGEASGAGLPRDQAMRLALLYIERAGNFPMALRALQAWRVPATAGAGPGIDREYFDLLADVAHESLRPDVYAEALGRLLQASTKTLLLREYQVERLLRLRASRGEHHAAHALASRAYALAPTQRLAVLWMDLLVQAPRREWLAQLLGALGAADAARLERDVEFVERRAAVRAALGERLAAAADYRAALALRPATGTRLAYWWLLVDMGDKTLLRREFASAGPAARGDPAFQEVLGAGWQLLGEPRLALSFYRRQAPSKVNDYLWLANYADLLEQAGEASLALRVRRHAFGVLGQAMRRMDASDRQAAAQALLARVRLAQGFASGEEQERLARLLGGVVADASLPSALRRQADDLVVSWALSAGRHEVARLWLWRQQALRMGLLARRGADGADAADGPDDATTQALRARDAALEYAEVSLALASGDLQALDRLMERSAGRLHAQDRLAALRALGRTEEAATLATSLAQRGEGPRDDAFQQALEDDLLRLASRVRGGYVTRQVDALAQRGMRLQAEVPVNPRLRLSASLLSLANQTRDRAVLADVPAHDRELAVGARLAIDGGEISASLGHRSAMGEVNSIVLRLSRQISRALNLQLEAARGQRSEDSTALAAAGRQDRLHAALGYQFSRELTLAGEAGLARYRTQGGAPLGDSRSIGAQAVWWLRRDDPDWQLRASWRRHLTRADGQPDAATARLSPTGAVPAADFFVPASASVAAFSVGYGMSMSDTAGEAGPYSRAWRPWAELGVEQRRTANSRQNAGLMRLGARGSVAGRDQLSVGLEIRPGSSGQTSREFRVQYEWITDR